MSYPHRFPPLLLLEAVIKFIWPPHVCETCAHWFPDHACDAECYLSGRWHDRWYHCEAWLRRPLWRKDA